QLRRRLRHARRLDKIGRNGSEAAFFELVHPRRKLHRTHRHLSNYIVTYGVDDNFSGCPHVVEGVLGRIVGYPAVGGKHHNRRIGTESVEETVWRQIWPAIFINGRSKSYGPG